MKQLNVLSTDDLKALKHQIGMINHDIGVISQNLNNEQCIKEYIELIQGYINKSFSILEVKE